MQRNLCLFLTCALICGALTASAVAAPVDDSRLAAAGIRKLESRHLTLYTDMPSSPAIDALPALFDEAVPLWGAYFGVGPRKTADWRVRAFLIGDRTKFEALDLLPTEVTLVHGYAKGGDVWLLDQSTDYYRRHLLLHEGTHAFMSTFLGDGGPGWYSEGMAELLGTHRGGAGSGEQGAGRKTESALELGIMPRDRQEVPMFGRIKLVRDAVAANRAKSLAAVMELDNRQQLGSEAYAWCWAAAKFLDSHPRYQKRFRKMQSRVAEPDFNDRFRRIFKPDWPELLAEWQAFVTTLDHGYDVERMAITFERGTPLAGKPREAEIRSDRGWQSSGVWLEAGKTYQLTARGRYQILLEKVAGVERAWPCEPGGVTIEYHDGHPLGMLLGAIVPVETSPAGDRDTGFAHPLSIGLGTRITPSASGTLYLRVNDSAARLGDNRGGLTITIAD
jgi:hypothetical protein